MIKKKGSFSSFSLSLSWSSSRFLSFFLDHFLGRVLVFFLFFLFSWSLSWSSSCFLTFFYKFPPQNVREEGVIEMITRQLQKSNLMFNLWMFISEFSAIVSAIFNLTRSKDINQTYQSNQWKSQKWWSISMKYLSQIYQKTKGLLNSLI